MLRLIISLASSVSGINFKPCSHHGFAGFFLFLIQEFLENNETQEYKNSQSAQKQIKKNAARKNIFGYAEL